MNFESLEITLMDLRMIVYLISLQDMAPLNFFSSLTVSTVIVLILDEI